MDNEDFIKEIQAKTVELSAVHGEVTPIMFVNPADDSKIVGYLKKLPFETKLRIMDSSLTGAYSACDMVLSHFLIEGVSDPRILTDDTYRMGAIHELYAQVKLSVNQFKKK